MALTERPSTTRGCAVVTGASGDIGVAVARRLLELGLHVVAVGRDRDRLSAKLARHGLGDHLDLTAADLTTAQGLEAVEAVVRTRERLDLLVLGSGVYHRSDDPAVLDLQFRANVLAPYALIRAMAPHLERSQGQVVVMNSTQGLKAAPGVGQYAATQYAMRALTDSLRDEMNVLGVRVLSLFLGRVATERQRDIFELEGRCYTPERLIQPDDVAQVIAAACQLPRTAEITEMMIRPMKKPL